MLIETTTFVCSICGDPSRSICVYCTKDACKNHLCDRCQRCSDCCECDIRLEEHMEEVSTEIPGDGFMVSGEGIVGFDELEPAPAAEVPLVETPVNEIPSLQPEVDETLRPLTSEPTPEPDKSE